MKALGFFDLFQQLGFTQSQSDLATLLILGRYVHPSSERKLRRYAKEQSALDELLGTNFSHIGNNALYCTSDLLFEHKDQIERFLRMRSKQIFSLKETIILYDLTNTYFTGKASGYKRGRSSTVWAKNDPGGWISLKKGQAFDKKTESKKSVQ